MLMIVTYSSQLKLLKHIIKNLQSMVDNHTGCIQPTTGAETEDEELMYIKRNTVFLTNYNC